MENNIFYVASIDELFDGNELCFRVGKSIILLRTLGKQLLLLERARRLDTFCNFDYDHDRKTKYSLKLSRTYRCDAPSLHSKHLEYVLN